MHSSADLDLASYFEAFGGKRGTYHQDCRTHSFRH
jgi:hypothetical protein